MAIETYVLSLPVDVQYNLAKKLAANCGYQLVAEDNEQSIMINIIIARIKENGPCVAVEADRDLILLGLEKLL